MKKLLLTLLLFSAGTGISAAKTYDLKSPDGKIAVRVDVGADAVTYSEGNAGGEQPNCVTIVDGLVSEGVDANYMDMINYALFGLIKLEFGEE